jgi:hypothetical protein
MYLVLRRFPIAEPATALAGVAPGHPLAPLVASGDGEGYKLTDRFLPVRFLSSVARPVVPHVAEEPAPLHGY